LKFCYRAAWYLFPLSFYVTLREELMYRKAARDIFSLAGNFELMMYVKKGYDEGPADDAV